MADIIVPAIQQAINLITSGDPEVYATVYRTIYVAGLGTAACMLVGYSNSCTLGSVQF